MSLAPQSSLELNRERKAFFGTWVLFVFAILLNFPGVAFLQTGFLTGDDVAQHLPWASFFSQSLRDFKLPLWTTLIHCGFPLSAEGQVGAFYPLNLLFYSLLPVKAAFNYSVLLHYFLGGTFFYLYVTSIGLRQAAALFASMIFLFGSTRGGLFINVTSQKVMIWFPLALYLADRLVREGKGKWAGWLGIVFALQVFAGYLQVAVYSIGMTVVYFLFVAPKNTSFFPLALKFCLGGVFSLLVASPQLVPTFELSQLSPRTELTEAFAYVSSASPLVLATLFFPGWDGILRSDPGIYGGILSLYFVLVSLVSKKEKKEKFFIFFFLLSLILALGQYSPLYVALVKLTRFYGFRVPGKFLFFAAFSLAILAGFGLQKLFKREEGLIKFNLVRVYGYFALLGSLALGFLVAVNIGLRIWRNQIIQIAWSYVKSRIYGTPYHPHSIEFYWNKLNSVYDVTLQTISPLSSETLACLVTIPVTMGILWLLIQRRVSFHRARWLLVGIIFLDLYFYGFTSVKFGIRDWSWMSPKTKALEVIHADPEMFRVYEFEEREAADEERLPIFPNLNMWYGLQEVGAYSPFVMKDYRDLLSNLGGINDSLISYKGVREKLSEELRVLSLLNVKYLLSRSEVNDGRLRKLFQDGRFFVYENTDVFPRAYFVTQFQITGRQRNMDQIRARLLGLGREEVLLEETPVRPVSERRIFEAIPLSKYEQDEVLLQYHAPENGYLVLADLDYPGWEVTVNGKKEEILRANGVLRAVYLEKGENVVKFKFVPPHFVPTVLLSGLSLAAFLFVQIVARS